LEEFLVRKDVKGLIDRRLLKVISTESSSKDIISGLNLKIGNLKIDMDQDQKEFVKLKSKLRKIREIVNNELFSEKSRLSKINKILSTLGEYPDE
jgi:negative regulator of replication initiation